MIPSIDIRADMASVKARMGALEQNTLPAAVRSLNAVVTSVRVEAVNDLKGDYPGLKVSSLKARMKLVRATRGTPSAAVVFSPGRIQLYGNFGMRSRKGFGVSFSKLPWKVETLEGDTVDTGMLSRAFRNRLTRSGRPAVLARLGAARYPITVLVAPAIAKAVVEKRITSALMALGQAKFVSSFTSEVRYLLSKK